MRDSAWPTRMPVYYNGQPVTYYPSQACFKNAYSRSAIAAWNNKSPPNTGPAQNPKVDGTTNPFAPLKQWSDVTFLEYQQQRGSDLTCLKGLKGVLRYQISNTYTRNVVTKFLGDTN
jgi:hypothetical protein